jgi:hypothetical protein
MRGAKVLYLGCLFALATLFRTRGLACLLPGALLWLVSPSHAEEPVRHILILHSYNYTFPATNLASDGARSRLQERSPQKIELDAEYLDLARFAEPGHETLMANFLRDRYANRRPDIVMVIGGDALPFVLKHRDEFAPRVPVVFLGVSRQGYATAKPPPDVTGHIVDLDLNLNETITLAERLQPDARHLFIVAGSGLIDRRWQPIARRVVEARERKLETTYLSTSLTMNSSPRCRRFPGIQSLSSCRYSAMAVGKRSCRARLPRT